MSLTSLPVTCLKLLLASLTACLIVSLVIPAFLITSATLISIGAAAAKLAAIVTGSPIYTPSPE